MIRNDNIDGGKPFDWGKTSEDYARFRDIYPPGFYEKITSRGLCTKGHRVLDLGTGTGVLPRNMYSCGAEWTGTDISEEQIAKARQLAAEEGMKIEFLAVPAEELDFPAGYFDEVTACQCFWYFDTEKLMPRLDELLVPRGKLIILCMEWLPFDDEIAGRSEELVLKYNPGWTGAGETRKPVYIPEKVYEYFDLIDSEDYDINVRFTRESWNGRMKACRGTGASLPPDELEKWEKEHMEMLRKTAPDEFDVLHHAGIAVLEKKR